MTIKLCLVPEADANNPVNMGSVYALKNKSKWIDASDFSAFLTVGYVKGVDFVIHENKTYFMKKSFVIPSEKTVVILCEESVAGCDVP